MDNSFLETNKPKAVCTQNIWYNYYERATIIQLFMGKWHCLTLVIQDGKLLGNKSFIRFKLPKVCGGGIAVHHFNRELMGVSNTDLYCLYQKMVKEYYDCNPDKKQIMQDYHLTRALKYS